jgi:hypothetical protein
MIFLPVRGQSEYFRRARRLNTVLFELKILTAALNLQNFAKYLYYNVYCYTLLYRLIHTTVVNSCLWSSIYSTNFTVCQFLYRTSLFT